MTDQIEKEKNLPTEKAKIETGLTVMGGLIPKDFDGLYRFCTILAASGLMPRGLEKVEAVFVAVQMGLEVGLSPMQAVQNIAPINGRPAIWGDAVLGLVRASGLLEDFVESTEGTYPDDDFRAVCSGKRKGEKVPFVREFSIADAKQAGLWCQDTNNDKLKYTPWYKYPKRMLQMRARSWALRDGFGDVLKGLRVAEEVLDYDIDLARTSNGAYVAKTDTPPISDLSEKIKQAEKEQPTKDVASEPSEPEKLETVEENKEDADLQKMEPETPLGFISAKATEEVKEMQEKEELPKLKETDATLAPFDWEAFREEWINLRTPGFSSYVHKNRSKWDNAPAEMQTEGQEKWVGLYSVAPWPVKNKPVDNEEDKVQMIKAMGDYFEQSDITKALHEHGQTTLTACDMATLRKLYKYLRENKEKIA